MKVFAAIRSNWRILLLVVLLFASAYFLFVPGAPIAGPGADGDGGNASAGSTNVQYGIELAGGARISAPAHGYIATDLGELPDDAAPIQQAVAEATNVSETDVVTSSDLGGREGFPSSGAVEVRGNVSRDAFERGLENAGLSPDDASIREGVSSYSLDLMVEVLDSRLGESGLGGGSVTSVQSPQSERDQVRIEAPGRSLGELEALVAPRGQVEIVAHYPDPDGEGAQREVLLTQEDFNAGTVDNPDGGSPFVPVTVTQSAADEMTNFMQDSGFAAQGAGSVCEGLEPRDDEYCILTRVDNETVYSSGITPGLADNFQTGEFRQTRYFQVQTPDVATAQSLLIDMRAGALPTTLDFGDSQQFLISPALAEDFRQNSLLTGIVAVIAVVVMVFARYGNPRVAIPMAATALSEVVILLGFAAAIGWPLELSHVAGFIAVIGTGVDDLIIIADEIQAQSEAKSRRVFQKRFRKAFWVIGAAALTTIVAMSPLAILNLGQLRGFAIITILGVIIGVAVSRPAYGSILRRLTTEGQGS